MNHRRLPKSKFPVTVCITLLALVCLLGSAFAALTMTGDFQQSATSFTPTWTVASSLISGMSPADQSGDFLAEGNTPGVSALTDGVIGPVSSSNVDVYAAAGAGAGTSVTYELPVQPNGYDVTNITVYSGWENGGRIGQAYTILYSTVANPGNFIWLTNVSYSAGFAGNAPANPISIRVQLSGSSGEAIAVNVSAIKIDFTCPRADNENGGTGYSEITVGGTPSVAVISPVISISATTETGPSPFTPSWTEEAPDLISGLNPEVATGSFSNENCFNGTTVLTDDVIGSSGDESGFASCGASGGNTLVYTLGNSPNGSDLTNIVVYSGWGDSGRHGQYFTVSYATVSAQSAFVPLTTVFYLPQGLTNAPANRVAIFTSTGEPLAKNVLKLKFDFASPPGAASFNNGWQGYSEMVVQGYDSMPPTVGQSPILVQDTAPSYIETTTAGETVVFTASYSNTPPASLQWEKISGSPSITNNVNNGVITVTNANVVISTLKITNVQPSDSGIYRLKAVNVADDTAAPTFSTAASLVVGSSPEPVNDVIVNYAGQTYPAGITNFVPAWSVDTNHLNLILGFQSGNGPGTFVSLGNFAGPGIFGNPDPTILSDGIVGAMGSVPDYNFCGCGRLDYNAGYNITYTLNTNSAPFGIDITNITVFGGAADANHNEQKYQVLYSTVEAPESFAPLITADYVPTDLNNSPTVSRTTLVPVTGVLARNVAALKFNWSLSSAPKNGFGGYSEILVGGKPATGLVPALTNDVSPNTASDVIGSQIILTAGFSDATSLQWQKDGVNLPGATASTLALNSLKLTDAGSYSLIASNAAGENHSSTCTVTVNPPSTAVANAVVSIAAQTSLAGIFTPTWNADHIDASLIYNTPPSAAGDGSFTYPDGNGENAADPSILTDGSLGFLESGDNSTCTCIGSDAGAGNYLTYELSGDENGYTITNITSYGGWVNTGRDQQAYTVYYSTVAAPTNFIQLAVVNYNPLNPVGLSATRATITPATGNLATHVFALHFDFTSPAGENGYSGYNEIAVFGVPSGVSLTAPTITSVTYSGGNLIVTGTGGYPPNSGYTLLSTTNLSAPVVWAPYGSGTLDNSGNFSNAIPVDTTLSRLFIRVQLP